jgi:hypothetical protein
MGIFNEKNVFEFQGEKYERLHNHPDGYKYRVIIDGDDYDYISSPLITKQLDEACSEECVVQAKGTPDE